jgi:hypothetical protein
MCYRHSPEVPVALDFTPPDNMELDRNPESPPRKPLIVEIQYDPLKGRYAAKDSRTGLLVLRHEDRARLKGMCRRMGWQVVDHVGWPVGA